MTLLLNRRNKILHRAGKPQSCSVDCPPHPISLRGCYGFPSQEKLDLAVLDHHLPPHLTKGVLPFSFTALSVFQIACASFAEANRDKHVRKVTRRN